MTFLLLCRFEAYTQEDKKLEKDIVDYLDAAKKLHEREIFRSTGKFISFSNHFKDIWLVSLYRFGKSDELWQFRSYER